MNSRAKGARGELQVAHLFKKYGYDAERGCQHDGMTGHADVVGVPYIWIEVKRREELNIEEAMQQAERDSQGYYARTNEELLPVVIHRKNNRPWKVSMRLCDLFYLGGALPYTADIPNDGICTMLFDDWIKVYLAYSQERS